MVKSREQLIRKIEAQIAVADEIGSDFISLLKGEGKAIIRLLEEDEERIEIMMDGKMIPDRESVITHLQIIRTWAKFARERDLQFFTEKHLEDIAEWTDDAIELLKEQEEKKGQWIPIESPTGVEAFGVKEMTVMNVRCSVCGSEEDVSFAGYKYCPRCGTKMEGRERDD